MNKQKLSKFKKSIKHHTPEIIVGLSLVAGAVALVSINKQLNSDPESIDLYVTKDELMKFIEEPGVLIFENLDRFDITLHHAID